MHCEPALGLGTAQKNIGGHITCIGFDAYRCRELALADTIANANHLAARKSQRLTRNIGTGS